MAEFSIKNTGKIQSLQKELTRKRNELLDILAEKDFLIRTVNPKIIYEYELVFGDLEKELQEKNRIAQIYEEEVLILFTKAKRGELITKQIVAETKRKIGKRIVDKNKITPRRIAINQSNNTHLPKDIRKIKKMFREIAKRIHPDLNEELNPYAKHWDTIFNAYKSNDFGKIIAYYNLICSDNNRQSNTINILTLEQSLRKLQRSIDFERRKVNRMLSSEPYVLQDILNDEAKKKEKEQKIKHKISQCEKSIEMSLAILNTVANNDTEIFGNDEDEKFQDEFKDNTYFKH